MLMFVIPALDRLMWENNAFEDSLSYTMSPKIEKTDSHLVGWVPLRYSIFCGS